ncbi:MAG: DUF3224 domain-containing protein [Actinomycetes bacterium]
MTTHATATFEVKSWEEQDYDQVEGAARVTRATVLMAFAGDIEGDGTVEYLMTYADDGTAGYVGQQRMHARIAGREGAFVVQAVGAFRDGVARSTWSVVPGSATGGLRGLRGEGTAEAPKGTIGTVTLDYDLG